MHEEMHMTHMQFMNTGAREIVSLLDTTSWGRAYVFKEVTRTFRWFAKERGSRQNPCMIRHNMGMYIVRHYPQTNIIKGVHDI